MLEGTPPMYPDNPFTAQQLFNVQKPCSFETNPELDNPILEDSTLLEA